MMCTSTEMEKCRTVAQILFLSEQSLKYNIDGVRVGRILRKPFSTSTSHRTTSTSIGSDVKMPVATESMGKNELTLITQYDQNSRGKDSVADLKSSITEPPKSQHERQG